MRKKLIVFLLSLGMCFGFASCGLFEPATSDSSVSTNSSSESNLNKEQVTITFKQSGYTDVVKTIEKGELI